MLDKEEENLLWRTSAQNAGAGVPQTRLVASRPPPINMAPLIKYVGAGWMLEFGSAELPGAVARCSEAMVGEGALSSSSTTLATTVAAEDEYS